MQYRDAADAASDVVVLLFAPNVDDIRDASFYNGEATTATFFTTCVITTTKYLH